VEDEGEEKKPKTVKKEVFDWDLINKQKPIWVRNSADVSEEEYNAFYKSFSKDSSDPIAYTHLRAEGDVEFSSLLYIPKAMKEDIMTVYTKAAKNFKLYVRRVFITDDLTDLLPRFLSFVTVYYF
jgi:heat shock protein beta